MGKRPVACELDEKGFVFVDPKGFPYHIRIWGGEPWLFYWHPDNKWVSLRTISQAEVLASSELALPDGQAELYHRRGGAHGPIPLYTKEGE